MVFFFVVILSNNLIVYVYDSKIYVVCVIKVGELRYDENVIILIICILIFIIYDL